MTHGSWSSYSLGCIFFIVVIVCGRGIVVVLDVDGHGYGIVVLEGS